MAFLINFKEINKLKSGSKNIHTIKRPIFVKDFFKTTQQLVDLEYISERVIESDAKSSINELIDNIKNGLKKDNNIYFEIRNSFIPALCLYDLNLQYEGDKIHMDYVLICNRYICVLETKKLSGNMYFNKKGELLKRIEDGVNCEKEFIIHNPIETVKETTFKLKNMLSKELNINFIPYYYISLACDEESKIDKNGCPNSIKNSIFIFDEVIEYLEKQFEKETYDLSEEDMYAAANLLLGMNVIEKFEYYKEYNILK